MSNKYHLINDKINLGDRLVHIMAQQPVTVTNIKSSEYEVTFDNGFVGRYTADILRSIFIRYDTYLKVKEQHEIDNVANEVKQFLFKRKQ